MSYYAMFTSEGKLLIKGRGEAGLDGIIFAYSGHIRCTCLNILKLLRIKGSRRIGGGNE